MRPLLLIVVSLTFLTGCSSPVVDEAGTLEVVMCPACKADFERSLEGASSVSCALYDVGKDMTPALSAVDAQVITDDETKAAYGSPYVSSGLMHHKFCVVNNSVLLTGSYNPTDSGHQSRNALLIASSPTLASNYQVEWDRLSGKTFSRVRHKVQVGDVLVENYFCPRHNCEDQVVRALQSANKSIRFMTYSFTSDPIGHAVLAAKQAGISVAGVCDPSQLSEHSECAMLGARVWDGPYLLHHKTFIIDESVVVMGSFNPTANGNTRNNENVIIIHDKKIAAEFLQEFEIVNAQSTP